MLEEAVVEGPQPNVPVGRAREILGALVALAILDLGGQTCALGQGAVLETMTVTFSRSGSN